MKESETMNRDELIDLSKQYDSMYWHNATNKAARLVNCLVLDYYKN
jgi:hypothetical protein